MGGVNELPVYTYDSEVDVLYVQFKEEPDSGIDRTEEIGPSLHVDLDQNGDVIGVEVLYPRAKGIDVRGLEERYGIKLEIPFVFAV